MQILIITGIFPPDIGGPATYVPQIAKGLAERGHRVTVLTLSDRQDHDDLHYLFSVVRLRRGILKPWRQWLTLATILRLGRKADVLFVNGLAFEAALANLVLRKPLVLKVVGDLAWERATVRGWVSDDFEAFQTRYVSPRATGCALKIKILKALRTWWTRQADRVIVPSEYLKRTVVGWGISTERCTVILNAVEVHPDPDQAPPIPSHFRNGRLRVITVGRLVPWKGVDKMIQAFGQLPDVSLTVVGEGPCRAEWEALADTLAVADRVWFTGTLPQAGAHALMQNHEVLLLTSSYEGLPHLAVEAMLLGLPVVATSVGGTPEVVRDGKTGILVPPEDGALQDVLRRLPQDPDERKRLGEAARRWARERFRVDRMLEQTESLLAARAR